MKNNILKEYNKELTMLLIVNIAVFLFLSDNQKLWSIFENNKILLPVIISFISPLLIADIIPTSWKNLLTGYLEYRDKSKIYRIIFKFISSNHEKTFQKYSYLPGFLIFTNLEDNKIKNEKINLNLLKQKYKKFPEDPMKQNDLWYAIYRSHEESIRIFQNYKNWFMLRDMVTLDIVLLIVMVAFSVLTNLKVTSIWIGFMLLQTVIGILACRRYCNRYVEYALVEETYDIINNKTLKDYNQVLLSAENINKN